MIPRIHLILPNAYKLMCFDGNINENRNVRSLECDYLLVQWCMELTLVKSCEYVTQNNSCTIIYAPLCIYVCNWSSPTGQLELIHRQKRTGLFYLGFMIFYIWNVLIAPSSLYLNGIEWDDIFNWCSKP
jgi:hypothetical protein